ncbi:MAG: S28 family serine protease [Candidatus Thiodiazotropha sp.]
MTNDHVHISSCNSLRILQLAILHFQPYRDLSSDNMKYLSSRQALADAANFIADLRKWVKYGIQNSTLIVFGGGYAGTS